MRGAGHADVPVVLQMPGNKADAVPCERLHGFYADLAASHPIKAFFLADPQRY
jgi:hypothetical protein